MPTHPKQNVLSNNTPSAEKNRPLYKHAPRWDDIRIVPGATTKGAAADPTLTTWQPGGAGTAYAVYAFDQDDELFFTCQMPHGYVIGSDMDVHVHWTPHDRGTTESTKTVEWKVDLSFAPLDGTFPASTEYDLTDTCPNANHVHLMTPTPTVSAASLTTVSSMIVGRVFRDNGDTWVGGGVNAPVLLEIDLHYQTDDIGSVFVASKKFV